MCISLAKLVKVFFLFPICYWFCHSDELRLSISYGKISRKTDRQGHQMLNKLTESVHVYRRNDEHFEFLPALIYFLLQQFDATENVSTMKFRLIGRTLIPLFRCVKLFEHIKSRHCHV